MFDTVESMLKELVDPSTSKDRRNTVYEKLTEATKQTEQSTTGAVLGGLGLGALGLVAGAPAGKYITKHLLSKQPEGTAEMFGKGLSEGMSFNPMTERLGKEMTEDIAADPANAAKLTMDFGKSVGSSFIGGSLGGIGGFYGGGMMGEETQHPQAEEALRVLADPNVPAEKKKALAAMYQAHANAVENSKGSQMLQALAGMGVQIPLAVALNFGGGKRIGEMLVPDKRLANSWIANTKGGRAFMAESAGDTAIGSPLGAAAGVAAYNASGSDYEDPFRKNDVNGVNRTR